MSKHANSEIEGLDPALLEEISPFTVIIHGAYHTPDGDVAKIGHPELRAHVLAAMNRITPTNLHEAGRVAKLLERLWMRAPEDKSLGGTEHEVPNLVSHKKGLFFGSLTIPKGLTEREKIVLEKRSSDEAAPHTYKEIGVELGVTQERVRQIEIAALPKVKWHEQYPGRHAVYDAITFNKFNSESLGLPPAQIHDLGVFVVAETHPSLILNEQPEQLLLELDTAEQVLHR